jgi:hypothetical protein
MGDRRGGGALPARFYRPQVSTVGLTKFLKTKDTEPLALAATAFINIPAGHNNCSSGESKQPTALHSGRVKLPATCTVTAESFFI